jgi:hypothetical protein
MSVISGTWDDIKLMCTHRHEVPIEMVIQKGPTSLFFACPKYYASNCADGEPRCNNRLNLVDHDKMIAHLDKLRYEAEMNNEKLILTNYDWDIKSKGIRYVVLSHEGDKLEVGMINKVAINK